MLYGTGHKFGGRKITVFGLPPQILEKNQIEEQK